MDASFVTTSKRLQRLCNFTRKLITRIPNRSHFYIFVFAEVSNYLERKCPHPFEAPPEPQLYGLVVTNITGNNVLIGNEMFEFLAPLAIELNGSDFNKDFTAHNSPNLM